MSFFDTLDNLKYQIGRFLWPTIFLFVGIVFLKIALVPAVEELNNGKMLTIEQSPMFLYGALFFLLGSAVWFLYLFGIIKSFIGYAVLTIMIISSAYLLYADFNTVDKDVKYNALYTKMDQDIRARILDIKAAQSAFKEYNKYYTNNIDSLIWFVKNGSKMSVPQTGKLPERTITPEERDYIYGDNRPIDKLMTDREAHALVHGPNPPADLKGFSRDTVYLPVLEAIFYSEKFILGREKIGENLIAFHPDSLKYVPYCGRIVTIDTSSVLKGEIKVPTLMIQMIHPMDSTKVYQIGDLKDNHLRDNWSR